MDPIGKKPLGFHGLSMGYKSSFYNNIISCFIFYFGFHLNNTIFLKKKSYVLKMCYLLNNIYVLICNIYFTVKLLNFLNEKLL